MRPAYVTGLGLWTPGYGDPAAWCRGEPDPEQVAPEAALLAGPMRRRASPISRAAIEALGQAAREAGCDLATLPSVWATAHGEHENAVAILTMMQRAEGKLSPTRFHNSVYNTASGYASIASANHAPSTTLAGGRDLAATALLEALCQLEAGVDEVALVLFDEPLLPPFDPRGALAPLALAFCLSSRPRGALAVLSNLRRDSLAAVKQNERFGDLYVSAGLPLLEHVVGASPGSVALELEGSGREPVWCVDVELVSA